MRIKKKIDEDILKFREIDEENAPVEQKLNELIALLNNANLDSEKAKAYKQRIDEAIHKATLYKQQIADFAAVGDDISLSRNEMLDRMGELLASHKIDSQTVVRNRKKHLQHFVLCLIAVVLIILGFAMIIMPAPPSFEIYTIFYFSENDGVTVMDVVSLLIVLCGVYLFIVSLGKFRRS